jgi:hypothetical protein
LRGGTVSDVIIIMIADASCPSKLLATVDNMPSRKILAVRGNVGGKKLEKIGDTVKGIWYIGV